MFVCFLPKPSGAPLSQQPAGQFVAGLSRSQPASRPVSPSVIQSVRQSHPPSVRPLQTERDFGGENTAQLSPLVFKMRARPGPARRKTGGFNSKGRKASDFRLNKGVCFFFSCSCCLCVLVAFYSANATNLFLLQKRLQE